MTEKNTKYDKCLNKFSFFENSSCFLNRGRGIIVGGKDVSKMINLVKNYKKNSRGKSFFAHVFKRK